MNGDAVCLRADVGGRVIFLEDCRLGGDFSTLLIPWMKSSLRLILLLVEGWLGEL